MDTNYTATINAYSQYKILREKLVREIKKQDKYLCWSKIILGASALLGIGSAVTPAELSMDLSTMATSLNVGIVSTLLVCERDLHLIKKQIKNLENQL